MKARFGCDSLISLATCCGAEPRVRTVNAYYEDGAFYVITYALSNKIKELADNPRAAVCGDWMTAQGIGENLGHPCDARNAVIAQKLRSVFSAWYGNGHVNEEDPYTCILKITLASAVIFADGTRYDLTFN